MTARGSHVGTDELRRHPGRAPARDVRHRMVGRPASHVRHVPARRVAAAIAVTVLAAGGELAGAVGGGSLFLVADAVHLVAHLAIFGVLLVPVGQAHEATEDRTIIAVLVLVGAIATGIDAAALRALASTRPASPEPGLMALAVLGLAANLTTAWLFHRPAQSHWSFRAALAHELADGMITVAGLLGALAIAVHGWWWADPALCLAIGLWLNVWVLRLFTMRIRLGARAWTLPEH